MSAVDGLTFRFKADVGDFNSAVAQVRAGLAGAGQQAQSAARQMTQGLAEASRSSQQLNQSLSQTRGVLASFVGGFAVGAITQVFSSLISAAKEYGSELREIGETAKRTGLSIRALDGTLNATAKAGISTKEALSDINQLGAKANTQFREGEGDLKSLLEANNLKLTDRKGNLKDTNSLLEDAARLVSNANSEFDKIDIARIFGLSEDWVKVLEKGPDALRASQAEVSSLAARLDADMIAKAQEFDAAWASAWQSFSNNAKAAIVGAAEGLRSLADQATSTFAKFMASQSWLPQTTRDQYSQILYGTPHAGGARDDGHGSGDGQPYSSGGLEIDIPYRRRPGGTVIPTRGGGRGRGGGGRSGPDIDAIERYIIGLQKTAELARVEADTWGKGNLARQQAIAQVNLKATAERAGLKVTEEQKQKVAQITAEYVKQQEELERLKDQQQSFNEIARTFEGAIEDWVLNGEKFEDVLKNLAKQLASMALQAALLGEGPLAGLFGTKSLTGGTGGLFGMLGGLFGVRAAGGNVSKDRSYIVGENGPELFRPNASGAVTNIPQGGASGQSVHFTYNVGAGVTKAELMAVLKQNERRIVPKVQDAIRRGAF